MTGEVLSCRNDTPASIENDPASLGLSTRSITVRFGGITALDGVSISAPIGQITGLIGPNGAGKTTLFNVCSGYQRPQQGSVALNGEDITEVSTVQRARMGMGRTFQRLALFNSMSVVDNVLLALDARSATAGLERSRALFLRRRDRREKSRHRAQEVLEMVGLFGEGDKAAGELTTGQGRLLELARAIAYEPSVLLLDEPSSGLDVAETAAFGGLILHLSKALNIGILLVEHDMSLVMRVCRRITVLEFGRLFFEGTPEEVGSSSEVQDAYLGRSNLSTPGETPE